MIAKVVIFAVGLLVLCNNLVSATNHTGFLEEAVNHLVDYTAAESGKVLDSLNIKKRVSDTAQLQFDIKIGN